MNLKPPFQNLIEAGDLECLKEVTAVLEEDDLKTAFLHETSLDGNSFMEAAFAGDAEILEYLYYVGVDVLRLDASEFLDDVDIYEDNAFNYAVQEGHLDAAVFLHSVGANIKQVRVFVFTIEDASVDGSLDENVVLFCLETPNL